MSSRAIPLVVGINQRSSSLAVRDRLYVEEHAYGAFLENLRGAGITQALLVSTCDRVEVQAMHADPEAASRKIAAIMARHGGYEPEEIADQFYVITGRDRRCGTCSRWHPRSKAPWSASRTCSVR